MDFIRPGILDHSVVFAFIIFLMSVLDELLSKIARKSYLRGFQRYFVYMGLNGNIRSSNLYLRWSLKISIPALLILISYLAEITADDTAAALYQAFAGFAFFDYLIIDLRHLENILIYRLSGTDNSSRRSPDLEGELIIGRRFALMKSAFQVFVIALLLFGVLIFHPTYFIFGGMVAPMLISIRNLILSNTLKSNLF